MATTYLCRLFGGRDLGVAYDSVAGTLSIMNQSVSIASLPTSLQQQWQTAVGTTNPNQAGSPAFGGDNIRAAVGAILDATPTWNAAVRAAVAGYVASISPGNLNGDPESWNR